MSKETQNGLSFPESEVREIPLDQIEPDKNQLRKEFKPDELEALAASIKENGLIQPILVTSGKDGKYQIVDGERRWRACTMLAEQTTTVSEPSEEVRTIRAIYVSGDNQLVGILGNIARNSYNPMEMADALALVKRMLGAEAKDADVAKHIGRSRTIVVEYNSLTKLPKRIQEKARKNSCVPFNKLKSLAASKGTEEEKIAVYEVLHRKYSADKTDGNPKEKDDKQAQNRETRNVVAVRKKLDTMKMALDSVQFDEKVDDKEKENFLKSLQEIINTAQAVQQKLTK